MPTVMASKAHAARVFPNWQVDFSPKDLAQVSTFLAGENVAKQVRRVCVCV